jgi:hypothetical protein
MRDGVARLVGYVPCMVRIWTHRARVPASSQAARARRRALPQPNAAMPCGRANQRASGVRKTGPSAGSWAINTQPTTDTAAIVFERGNLPSDRRFATYAEKHFRLAWNSVAGLPRSLGQALTSSRVT